MARSINNSSSESSESSGDLYSSKLSGPESESSGESYQPRARSPRHTNVTLNGRGRGRGRGRARSPRHNNVTINRRGRGQGRSPRHTNETLRGHGRKEGEEVTLVTSVPGIGNTCATDSNARRNGEGATMNTLRPGIDNSHDRSPNFQERPEEIGSSRAPSFNEVADTLLPSQTNEAGTGSKDFLTLDNTKLLECPICSEILRIPVLQCANGHLACSKCRRALHYKCHCLSRFDIRCRVMEHLLRGVKTSCLNSKYGCKERVSYIMKNAHERSCIYEPCTCPLPGCGFDGSYRDLYLHFTSNHSASATRFTFDSSFPVCTSADMNYKFLQERDDTHSSYLIMVSRIMEM